VVHIIVTTLAQGFSELNPYEEVKSRMHKPEIRPPPREFISGFERI